MHTKSIINIHFFSKNLRIILIISACIYLLFYFFIALNRINYPYDLEWIEGGMVDQVQHFIITGKIYVSPSINFVPFLYPPLFFLFSAVTSSIFGIGYFSLRFVSFVASIVIFITIYLIVFEETKEWWVSILSVGLFSATFRVTGAWLDIARVDTLFVALWILFVYIIRKKESYFYSFLAGVLAALAFLTKQTALIVCLPVIIYLIYKNWKYGLTLFTTTIAIICFTTLLLNRSSDGWFFFYVFTLLRQQTEWVPLMFISFWANDLLFHIPIAILFSLYFLNNKLNGKRTLSLLWIFIFFGALAGTFLTRVKWGGYDNVLLPLYVVFSVTFGLGLNELEKKIDNSNDRRKNVTKIFISAACLSQLIILFYNPFSQIPTKNDLQAGNELVKYISSVKGKVFLPDNGYLSTIAGKEAFAHNSAIWDIVRGNKDTVEKEILSEDLSNIIKNQYFDVIILSTKDLKYYCENIDKYYIQQKVPYTNTSSFYTITGAKLRPTTIYIAKRLLQKE